MSMDTPARPLAEPYAVRPLAEQYSHIRWGAVIAGADVTVTNTANGTIDGGSEGFSPKELDYLVSTLSAGSLPAQLEDEPISERTVGPQLGQDNLRKGLLACVLGLVVVAVFLCGYYFLAGVVATFTRA